MKTSEIMEGRYALAAPPATLQDVADALAELYTESSAGTNASKLKKVGEVLGTRLALLPADPTRLEPMLRRAPFAGHFKGTETAQARKRDEWIGRVLKICERFFETRRGATPAGSAAAAEWAAVQAYVAARENVFDEDGALVFANMSSLSIANLKAEMGHVRPAELTSERIEADLPHLGSRRLDKLRNSRLFFNKLILSQNRHPEIAGLLPTTPLRPFLRRRPGPLDWSLYPASLKADVEAALEAVVRNGADAAEDALAALGEGINPAEVIATLKKTKKIKKKSGALKRYGVSLRWLIREADAAEILAPDEMTGLAVLLRYDMVAKLKEAWKAKAKASPHLKNPEETSTLHAHLNRLEVVAKRHLEDEVEAGRIAILRIADDEVSNPYVREMAKDREDFVSYLQATPEAVEALVEGPFGLVRDARARLERWDDLRHAERVAALRLYASAMVIALQIVRPLRPDNVRLLTIDGEGANIRRPTTGRGSPLLRLGRTETKNQWKIEHAIPPDVWRIVKEWLETWRAKFIELFGLADSDRLIPGRCDSGALSTQGFADLWRIGAETLGLPQMTPHMSRHAVATIWLAAHPGDFATLASILGDEEATVRAHYGRDQGAEAAARLRRLLEKRFPGLFELTAP